MMNSENFMLQSSLEANYLNIRLDPEDRLDEIAMKVIQKDCPDFLIPFRVVSVNEETSLKYKLINTVALEYAEMTLPKALFVQLYLNLLEPFVRGKDWFLDYHNLCVDTRFVYVDKHTYRVFYIYAPVRSFRSTDQEILDFFKNVFMNVMISDDKDFQVRLFRFFGGSHITLAGLYQMMQEEKGIAASSSQPAPYHAASSHPAGRQGDSQPFPDPQAGFRHPASQSGGFQSSPDPQAGFRHPASQSGGFQPSPDPQAGFRHPANQPGGFQQSADQQTAFPQPGFQPFPFSQSVKPAEEKKKTDADNRKKEKKLPAEKDSVPSPQMSPGYGEGSEDEVVQALFGNNKKGKKEKPPAESRKAQKESDRKKQDEKGHGGLGGLFGGKKKQQKTDPVQSQGSEHIMESGGQAAYAGASGSYVSGPVDYAAMYGGSGSGSDETEVFSDGAAAVGAPWLELIDFSQPGALQRIDLTFTKPYITIGRMSSDEKCPDVAFPGEFKRIGRQHARIERRGDDFFVIDLGSANHTMVNGQILVPNQPYPLQDGMELAFTVSKPVRYRVHI